MIQESPCKICGEGHRTGYCQENKEPKEKNFESLVESIQLERIIPKRESKGTLKIDNYKVLDENGDELGAFTLQIQMPPKREWTAYMNTVSVHDQKNGIGTALYIKLIKELADKDITLKSGFQLSESAWKLWKRLERLGYAECTFEGEVIPGKEKAGFSNAEFNSIVRKSDS